MVTIAVTADFGDFMQFFVGFQGSRENTEVLSSPSQYLILFFSFLVSSRPDARVFPCSPTRERLTPQGAP